MSKTYQYLDPAGSNELINTILEFSDDAIANMVTDVISPSSGNKAPSASAVNTIVTKLRSALENIQVMIDDSYKEIDNTKEIINETIKDTSKQLADINDEFDKKTTGVDFIKLYVVNCRYNEIADPINNSIYIYKDNNKHRLGYYNQGNWYISGVDIPEFNEEILIKSEDIEFLNGDFIHDQVHTAYLRVQNRRD